MANKIGLKTLDRIQILLLDADPTTDGIGYDAPMGSQALLSSGRMFIKKGPADLDWKRITDLDDVAGDVDTLVVLNSFGNADGLTIENTGINEETFRLTHDASITKFAESTLDVSEKFRGKNIDLFVDLNTTAESGNFKVIITDETNAAAVLADEVLTPQDAGITSVKRRVSFFTETNTASIKVRFEALPEAGTPVSDFDDVVLQLSLTEKLELSVIEQEINAFTLNVQNDGVSAVSTGSSPGYQWWDSITRNSTGNVTIDYTSLGLSQIPALNAAALTVNGNRTASIINETATSVTVDLRDSDSGILKDEPFSFQLIKQGSDYENLTRKVERELSTFHEVIQEQSDSAVRLSGHNGVSSTFTNTLRFDALTESFGDDVTLIQSATDGDYFIINTDGPYNLSVSSRFGLGGIDLGIAKNVSSSEATTAPSAFADQSKILALTTRPNNDNHSATASATAYLKTGDKISAIVSSSSTPTPDYAQFQITKVGSSKIAQAAPDSKIEIPTSELRMEGSSSLGTGAESNTAQFDAVAKVRGDAFEIDNTNGTVVTIKKDGLVSISSSLYI